MSNLKEIDNYFKTNGYKYKPIVIKKGLTVFDSEKFITTSINTLQNHSGEKAYYSVFYLLNLYYKIIKNEKL